MGRDNSMIKVMKILVCVMTFWATAVPAKAYEFPTQEARTYILQKSVDHHIVFMGTTHRQPPILNFIADLLPWLHTAGITHLALEVAGDQQANINRYLTSGKGLADIELHQAIDCPRYRHLFTILRKLAPSKRPHVVALDLPSDHYAGPIDRDTYMATVLTEVYRADPESKVLAILGTFHVFRQLRWVRRISGGQHAIRTQLSSRHPELNMFSVAHILSQSDPNCDFSTRIEPVLGSVALDVDQAFDHWRLGLTACLAIQNAPIRHILDGLIVH